jgi:hypothetical protein
MTRIERVTSPLPRECSTTEPHGHRHGSGLSGLEPRPVTTTKQHLNSRRTQQPTRLERETGIEPVSLAWKAKVLPLNYSRRQPPRGPVWSSWWRRLDSNQRRRKPTDLQSAPFSHSGTPPRRTRDCSTARGMSSPRGHTCAGAHGFRQRPPVDALGRGDEVAAFCHEQLVEVIGRMTGAQHQGCSAGTGHRLIKEGLRLGTPQQEDRRIWSRMQEIDDLRCERLPTTIQVTTNVPDLHGQCRVQQQGPLVGPAVKRPARRGVKTRSVCSQHREDAAQ